MKTKCLWILMSVNMLFGVTIGSAEQKPWEDPNSGFNSPNSTTQTTGSTGGYDKIDKVITSTGATKNDGQVVGTTGSEKDKGFVDGFLNNAASKITGVNGTASAWSWSKKWKIGPDGKPMEVVETYHEGSLNVTGSNNAKPAAPAATPTSGTTGSTPSASGPGPVTASVPGSNPGASPAAGPSPSVSAGPSVGPSASGPGPSGPSAATPPAPSAPPVTGVNVAPTALPQGIPANVIMAELGIIDQLSGQEQKFNSTVAPKTTSKPIPEDVRTKFSLDVAETMKEKVKVAVNDPDDPQEFPYQATFHHVFRTPSMDRYNVVVTYPDQTTGVYKPILTVQVPVYKMNFKSTTLQATQNRISDDKELMSNINSSSPAYSGANSAGKSGGSSSSIGNPSEQVDVSDLYTNPENPPKLAGPGDSNDQSSNGQGIDAQQATVGQQRGAGQGVISQNLVAGAIPMASAGQNPRTTGSASNKNSTGSVAQNQSGKANTQSGHSVMPLSSGSSSGNPGVSVDSSGSSTGGGKFRQGSSSGKSALAYVGNEITPDNGSSESGESESSVGSSEGESSTAKGENTTTNENLSGHNSGNPSSFGSEGRSQMASRGNSDSGSPSGGATSGAVNTADRPYLISLTMKPSEAEAGQSFDFTDSPYPTSQTLKKGSQVTFIFDLAKSVQRESVQVVLYDGNAKNTLALSSLGNDMIDHKFSQQTAEAYVWVYGESQKGPFSYKLSIPVD